MPEFRKILFVSQGGNEEADALKQALSLARNNQARLAVLIVRPELPGEISAYREKYEDALIREFGAATAAAREAVKVTERDVPVTVKVEAGGTPAVRIVRHVIENGYDLVIKQAEAREGRGFRALDMELLRKCPSPVWLCRPIDRHRHEMRVAVAIDPDSPTPEGRTLSLRLLELARSLADSCSGVLDVVACWDFQLETYLRGNVWIKMTEPELARLVDQARAKSRAGLDELIRISGIAGEVKVHHVRGEAAEKIPQLADDERIDILVMGTLARTGIPGFVIGNTAENVVQGLACSLLALKPAGFVSPVRGR
ncbi:MAG: universal stress protein [Alphaproteobacteria bacterium]|nr:universal stress protein [Alphaproteobacteria bacterium]